MPDLWLLQSGLPGESHYHVLIFQFQLVEKAFFDKLLNFSRFLEKRLAF